jgi:hypothetical protein
MYVCNAESHKKNILMKFGLALPDPLASRLQVKQADQQPLPSASWK